MDALRGWIGAAHPFPLAMVLLLTAVVAIASSDGSAEPRTLGLVLLAMLCAQLAIGWSNDYLDRETDAVHQPAKPLPSGLIAARRLPPAIGAALVAGGVAGALLGTWPLVLLVVGTACGLAYNLGLKRTRYSPGAFIIAFSVLPLYVWTALDVYDGEYLAVFPIALSLPVAVHVANVLPDLDSDRAQGRRTIAVALGRTWAIGLTLTCMVAPLLLTALSAGWLEYDALVLLPSFAVYLMLSSTAFGLYAAGGGRPSDVWAFRCLALASVVFAAGWLAAIEVDAG